MKSRVGETTDRLGRIVVLTDESWAHIMAEHRELAGFQQEIRQAIALADEVRLDTMYRHRDIHYRHTGLGTLRFRVVVHYRPTELWGWTGEVITAFLTRRHYQSAVLRWP